MNALSRKTTLQKSKKLKLKKWKSRSLQQTEKTRTRK
ncbi:DUF1713 domain-containing protein [Caenorhabditis elegans]|uniref:DUF1713 domain-containing protein n=1 Tax=Caenorhabditis elegans TaxID=6239 RepID=Q9XVY6_CAEEL|nr:DUF1713 domain-containing protein [Caenorhabditis elegans]CAA22468.3 DUF1713 domain-containing protein [Caenorhabditis elegans]